MSVKRVIEGVQVVPMGMANAFLIEGDDGLTLIDAGFPGKQAVVFGAIRRTSSKKPSKKIASVSAWTKPLLSRNVSLRATVSSRASKCSAENIFMPSASAPLEKPITSARAISAKAPRAKNSNAAPAVPLTP